MDLFIYMVTQQILKDQKESRTTVKNFTGKHSQKMGPTKECPEKWWPKSERTLRRQDFPGQGCPMKTVYAGTLMKEPEISRQELIEVGVEKAFCYSGYSLTCGIYFNS